MLVGRRIAIARMITRLPLVDFFMRIFRFRVYSSSLFRLSAIGWSRSDEQVQRTVNRLCAQQVDQRLATASISLKESFLQEETGNATPPRAVDNGGRSTETCWAIRSK
jgi:hypothetical protein